MIFIGFEGIFSQSKSIKNHFQVEVAMKCAPRRPRDVSRRLQEAPKTLPRRLKASKMVPGRPQDGPKTAPGRSKTPPGRSKTLPQAPPKNQYFLHFSYVGFLVGLWWVFGGSLVGLWWVFGGSGSGPLTLMSNEYVGTGGTCVKVGEVGRCREREP